MQPSILRHLRPLLAATVAALLIACGASEPPPRSPLADPTSEGTVVVGVPSPLPTFPAATGTPGIPGPLNPDDEGLAGAAIDALAEWLGVPATAFTGITVESIEWPNACIGIERPGYACAEVVTPGWKVTLVTFGGAATYYVHADQEGRLAWAPLMDAPREVASVDVAGGRIALVPLAGSDEMGSEVVVVPGSRLDVALADLRPGDRTHIGIAPSPQPAGGPAPVVWLVMAEG